MLCYTPSSCNYTGSELILDPAERPVPLSGGAVVLLSGAILILLARHPPDNRRVGEKFGQWCERAAL